MAETLYRKYRPQTFGDIQGQEGIKKTLENQITSSRIAHAYIFAGTRGTGKTTTARVFAKAINCHNRAADSFEPCGQCASCTDITAGRSIDVIELDAATHTGVDTVREQIIENARTLPTRDRYKIFIIDEVHMLSTSSFNALLKSLEEPPAHVVYILATTELHKVPATVASRCQRFIFRPLSVEIMTRKLGSIAEREGVTVDASVIQRILAVSGGAMRDAESLLGQLIALGVEHITDTEADMLLLPSLFTETLSFITTLHSQDTKAAFELAQSLFESGIDLAQFHDTLTRRAHELLVVNAAGAVPLYLGVFSDEEKGQLLATAKQVSAGWLARLLDALVERKTLYRSISSPFIPLHLVIMELGTPAGPQPAAPTPGPGPAPHAPQPRAAAPTTPPAPAPKPAPIPDPAPTEASAPHEPATTTNAQAVPESTEQDAPAEAAPHPTTDGLTREALDQQWPHVIQDVVVKMPSLGIILHSTQIDGIRGSDVLLSVQFPLHYDKLADIKIKKQIEDALSARCGMQVRYVVTHVPDRTSGDPAVDDLLETFGGKVVA